jgi:cellulose biosynthesis protein BcsQ
MISQGKDGDMAKSICFFNHKGGVSKTTTAFNVGWELANQGKRVLLVDLDSQCNLTGMVLGFSKIFDGLESFYSSRDNLTMGPIVEFLINGGQPDRYLDTESGNLTNTLNKNLFLLPGHLNVSELDSQISVSLKIASGIPATRNIPGNLPRTLQIIADQNNIDYVIYDLSPNVGGLNEVILMSSDYFIVPATPDFFCWQAVKSLAINIPKWHAELSLFKMAHDSPSSRAIKNSPKFIGMIQQRYRPRNGAPAKSFELWISKIREAVDTILVPKLSEINCVQSKELIQKILDESHKNELSAYDLAHISDFNSLIAISQTLSVPVFDITDENIKDSGQFGHALNTMKQSRTSFKDQFSLLADRTIKITSN